MSAWTVTKAHIDYLIMAAKKFGIPIGVYWGQDGKRLPGSDPSEVGRMLWEENYKSVNFRYGDNTATPAYDFSAIGRQVEPVVVLKAISCYEYQSCEHGEWEASEAKQFCDSLAKATIATLPGFADAPWGID